MFRTLHNADNGYRQKVGIRKKFKCIQNIQISKKNPLSKNLNIRAVYTPNIQKLGYPSPATLYRWLEHKKAGITNCHAFVRLHKGCSNQKHSCNMPEHPRDLMSVRKKIQREPLVSRQISELPTSTDVARLQNQMDKLQMEIDVLHKTTYVLKEDPSADMRELSNREKAVIVSALKENNPLPLLLHEFDLPGNSYFYQMSATRQPDKYAVLRTQMREIFHENKGCYGYRKIWYKLQDRALSSRKRYSAGL